MPCLTGRGIQALEPWLFISGYPYSCIYPRQAPARAFFSSNSLGRSTSQTNRNAI